MQRIKLIALVLLAGSMPLTVAAQPSSQVQFSRGGIYDCNQNGSYAMSVGTIQAVTSGSGTYVPVNDSAVTQNTAGTLINTGTLLYKECVLRPVLNRMAESALTGLDNRTFNSFGTSRNGGPMYPQDFYEDFLERNDEVFARDVTNDSLEQLDPAFRTPIKRTLLRAYKASTRARPDALKCQHDGDLGPARRGERGSFSFAKLIALGQPACNPVFAYELARNQVYDSIAADGNEMMLRLNWGSGVYGVENTDEAGRRRTLTPGFMVRDVVSQATLSGYQRLLKADDIGQMVGSLFAAFGTQAMSSSGGFLGTLQGTNGQPSYLSQMVQESSDGLISSAVNVALRILAGARQLEAQFSDAVNGIVEALLDAARRIRGLEQTCWTEIVTRVCKSDISTSTNPMTCKDAGGNTLRVATTTTASRAIIDSQIAPIASSTQPDIDDAAASLARIDRLIASVTNTTSQETVRLALLELDQLVARRELHTPSDVSAANARRDNIAASMSALVQQTATDWGDSQDLNVGWCNYNNQAVIDMWATRWKQ